MVTQGNFYTHTKNIFDSLLNDCCKFLLRKKKGRWSFCLQVCLVHYICIQIIFRLFLLQMKIQLTSITKKNITLIRVQSIILTFLYYPLLYF